MEKLSRIKKRHKLANCAPLLAADLEEILFSLSDEVILSILSSRGIFIKNDLCIPTDRKV